MSRPPGAADAVSARDSVQAIVLELVMSLDEQQVRHVAQLARLALTDEEVAGMATTLSSILEYAEQVGEVAADDVEPSIHPWDRPNVQRADEVVSGEAGGVIAPADLLASAPDAEAQQFVVPTIVAD